MDDDSEDRGVNPSSNPAFGAVVDARLSRRAVLRGGLGAAALTVFASASRQRRADAAEAASRLGFTSVPVSTADTVVVPRGYAVDVLYAWGDPISDGPAFRPDASNTAAEQAL